MQEMTGPERRKAVRIEKIQAHVEFEGLVYKVVNISSDGVLIAANDSNLDAISECGAESGRDLSVSTSRGIDERVLAKMSEGPFRFALLSKASGHASDRASDRASSQMNLVGSVVRVNRGAAPDRKILEIAITFGSKP